MGDIYIVSDLHIGDGSVRDNFRYHDKRKKFDAFLDLVAQAPNSELLILGDIFELWQCYAGEVLRHNNALLDRLCAMQATCIYGNHDGEFAGNDGRCGGECLQHEFFRTRACGRIERTIGGQRFVFVHGHEGDPFNDGALPMSGNALAILAGILEDKLGSRYLDPAQTIPLEATLTSLGDTILGFIQHLADIFGKRKAQAIPGGAVRRGELAPVNGPEGMTPEQVQQFVDSEFKRYLLSNQSAPAANRGLTDWGIGLASLVGKNKDAGALLESHFKCMMALRAETGADRLICGHTHKPGVMGDWYANSGSWSDAGNDVLILDHTGAVTFHRFIADGSGFHLERVEPTVFPELK